VDALLSKPGYGTLTECIANGTPLVYVPRRGFREQEALIAGMTQWGGGIPIDETAFLAGQWGPALEQALAIQPDASVVPVDGAGRIAERLMQFCRGAN
jgi:L-arabinokinase